MSRTWRRLLAVAYALLGALGAAAVWQQGHPAMIFFGVLLLIVAIGGAAWLLLGPGSTGTDPNRCWPRRRRGRRPPTSRAPGS